MDTNGAGKEIVDREKLNRNIWQSGHGDHRNFRNGKRFFRCVCPKCAEAHNIYMLWSGRGIPRKYCGNCKPLVSGYDSAAIYEAAVHAPGHSKKKGRRNEGE